MCIRDRFDGDHWFILHRDVWLLDCISRDDRTGMSCLYGMGYVTCVLWVKRKLVRLINFLTWVDLFPCLLTVYIHVIIHELLLIGGKGN